MSANVPAAPRRVSALRELLDHAVIHEDAGGRISPTLVYYGLIGAGITIAVALFGLALDHPSALRHSGFLLILKSPAASVGTVLHTVWLPLLCIGSLLGFAGLYLLKPRPRSGHWRHAIVGQTVCGAAAASISSVFALFFIINLVIWLIIIVLSCVVIGLLLSALVDG